LGASQKLNDKFSAGILLDVAQSASAGNVGPIEATAYVSNKLSKTLKVQVNVLKGLSNGSPNFGFGAMITSVF
jgi:hypothetical protein